jgi:hypothetical protein
MIPRLLVGVRLRVMGLRKSLARQVAPTRTLSRPAGRVFRRTQREHQLPIHDVAMHESEAGKDRSHGTLQVGWCRSLLRLVVS